MEKNTPKKRYIYKGTKRKLIRRNVQVFEDSWEKLAEEAALRGMAAQRLLQIMLDMYMDVKPEDE